MRTGPAVALSALVCACSPEPRWIALAGAAPPALHVIAAPLTTGRRLPVPDRFGAPSAVLFGADGSSLYLVSSAGDLAYLRRADGAVLARARFDSPIAQLQLDTRRRRLLVVARDSLHAVDAASLQPAAQIALCGGVRGFVTVHPGDRGFATCAGDAVAVVDVGLRRVTRVAPLPLDAPCDPGAPALARDESVLLVPCRARGAVLVLDRITLGVVATFELDAAVHTVVAARNGSHALAWGARSAVVLNLVERRAGALALDGRPIAALADWNPGRARVLLDPAGVNHSGPVTHLVTVGLMDGTVRRDTLPGAFVALDIWPRERSPVMWWRR